MSTESLKNRAENSLGFRMGKIIETGLSDGRPIKQINDEINLLFFEARVNAEPDGWDWYHVVICFGIIGLFAFGILKFYLTGS